jgi:hypothetical protein
MMGDQPMVEYLQEIAARGDVQYWVGRKVFKMKHLGLVNPEAVARFRVMIEIETREQLLPIFSELGIAEDSMEVVMGLAEDMASESMERNGY